jgi:hypothetical protein
MINSKKIISSIACLNMTLIACIAGGMFYFSVLTKDPVNPRNEGFIATLARDAKFFKALGYKESTSQYDKVNKFGYIGRYQFGEETLSALGYYIKDGSKKNDWKGQWTGKCGVFSKEDFINSHLAQEIAVHELASANWDIAKSYKLDKFVGKVKHGVYVTREGILAAMHLKGPKSVNDFIFHGIDSTDGLGTGVKQYMRLFSDCDKIVTT